MSRTRCSMMVFWSSSLSLLGCGECHVEYPGSPVRMPMHLHFVENISFIFISTCFRLHLLGSFLRFIFFLSAGQITRFLHFFIVCLFSFFPFLHSSRSHHSLEWCILFFIKNFLLFTFNDRFTFEIIHKTKPAVVSFRFMGFFFAYLLFHRIVYLLVCGAHDYHFYLFFI